VKLWTWIRVRDRYGYELVRAAYALDVPAYTYNGETLLHPLTGYDFARPFESMGAR
jgi:hypothetical protein